MIHFPAQRRGPLSALSLRLLAALGLVFATVFVVWLDRDGYRDVDDTGLTLLDCFYYVVVSLSTTGYGDITPVSSSARLANVLFITPARVLFLIILVGTTLEVLTEQYRTGRRLSRWRRTVKDHVIICGYGTKGRSAVSALLEDLQSSGLLDSTLVVMAGEFGRTPRISTLPSAYKLPGRDHWGRVQTVFLAGGGVAGGRVVGSSDRIGAHPASDPQTPEDLAATIYHSLGIPPTTEWQDALGRPHQVYHGTPIGGLS